jgi:uncharacterized damage-inducible protein DinB
MGTRRTWFDRRFELGLPEEALPDILERLRGTPARLEERLLGVSASLLTARSGQSWSIQENVGHMLDLESLWLARIHNFLEGATELRATDLENRRTWDAKHNGESAAALLADFRSARAALVTQFEQLSSSQLRATSLHPRLRQPMTVTDHAFFVAEHDDHHLARISELLRHTAD